jgi:hypothetical protein
MVGGHGAVVILVIVQPQQLGGYATTAEGGGVGSSSAGYTFSCLVMLMIRSNFTQQQLCLVARLLGSSCGTFGSSFAG